MSYGGVPERPQRGPAIPHFPSRHCKEYGANFGQSMGIPEVTIIIPCYNRATLISECIQSAVSQTGRNIETIVVDDGSTDGSSEIINSFTESIRAIRIDNGGVSRARNFGIQEATGEYIQFLDSDDLLPPDAIEEQLNFSRGLSEGEVAVGRTTPLYDSPDHGAMNFYSVEHLAYGAEIPCERVVGSVLSSWLCLYPRKLLLTAGGFDETLHIGEDYELNFRLYRDGVRFIFSGAYSYQTRVHTGPRLSRSFEFADHQALQRVMTEASAFLRQHGAGRCGDEALTTLARWAWSMGRMAARSGEDGAARAYFALSRSADPDDCEIGRLPARVLYRLFDPVAAEHMMEGLKRIIGFLRS